MKKIPVLLSLFTVITLGLAGCGSSQASQSASSSSKNQSKISEDEGVIKTARNLNEDGHYQDSNKALNGISITDLSKKGFSSLKAEYFQIQKSNDAFLLK